MVYLKQSKSEKTDLVRTVKQNFQTDVPLL